MIIEPGGTRSNDALPGIPTNSNSTNRGVWIFYVAFFGLLVGEGLIVGAVIAISRAMHIEGYGGLIAWLLFVLGGAALGWIELRSIRPAQKMRDPVLRACCWLQGRFGVPGYLVNALFIGGAPGSAIALTQTSNPHRHSLTFLAAVLFASLWVPIFVLVWK
jgi:hypothetical protein